MIRFALGTLFGVLVYRWLSQKAASTSTVTYYPSVWGTSDGSGQWTFTANSPIT